jgi:lantibiotic biosynthesis protein
VDRKILTLAARASSLVVRQPVVERVNVRRTIVWRRRFTLAIVISVNLPFTMRSRTSMFLPHVLDLARRMEPLFPGAPWAANGAAGIAVFYRALDTALPHQGWDNVAHVSLERAVRSMCLAPTSPLGALDGRAGIAMTAVLLARDGSSYSTLLEQLDGLLEPDIDFAIDRLNASNHAGCATASFDVVSGLAGIGRYLLARGARAAEPAHRLVVALVALFGREHHGVPAWYTPGTGEDAPNASLPMGSLNCGMAHGAAGPLALFALYRLAGRDVPGLVPVILRIAQWLVASRDDDKWGPNWPAVVPLGSTAVVRTHNAWCYGSPGVARALWLAGKAIDCQALRDLAVAAMDAVHWRPPSARRIHLPCLCHGLAGIAQILSRFARDTGLQRFRQAATEFGMGLLAFQDRAMPLGMRALGHDGMRVDDPGLLNGAAGIGLALLTMSSDVDPTWDQLLMLS